VSRPNQKLRTRKDLLKAAARLMTEGRNPKLEEIAEEALVSRATAYRYFPGLDALLVEAALDIASPDAETFFDGNAPSDPAARVKKVDVAFHEMILGHEAPLRTMLAHSLQRSSGGDDLPRRQNRRSPLIEAALEPVRGEFDPVALERLKQALALVIGTEAMIVFKDVLGIEDAAARRVKGWMIDVLVAASRRND
jgi:AcrR family transcriptional regulator